jgi:FdrA protein
VTARTHVEVRHGSYHDSVSLLQVSTRLAGLPSVAAAQVAMATPLNLDVLASMGFDLPATAPDDLVVALRVDEAADDPDAVVATALEALAAALARREDRGGSGGADEVAPRTTGASLRRDPSPIVLVSVPGAHAAAEAWDALDAGSSVMLFSDNVPLEDEVALKTAAAQRGLLVMGPDCGTAVVGGVGLGFANAVRPGPVSLVAASGTGAQHLMALLDQAGVGVRHCLGLGGRDLAATVGGLGARSALDVLAADDATELVVLVSKPADPQVVSELEDHAASRGTPLVWAVLGPDQPDLTTAAETVLGRLGRTTPRWRTWGEPPRPGGGGLLRGLFAGGTLCDETMALAARRLGPVASNVPLDPSWPRLDASGPGALASALAAAGHAVVDLGDDSLTVGRAHPMIDPTLRVDALADAAADPRVRVVLLDVVLGHGAHADPASVHAPAVERAIATARADGRELGVVVSLVGTDADPQGLDRQGGTLAAAGAYVLVSNAQATAAALDLVDSR